MDGKIRPGFERCVRTPKRDRAKVANRLGAQVSSDEKAAIEEPPTTDLIAYDAYLRAKDLINGITFSPRAKEDLFQAVELLSQAVARDPSFFQCLLRARRSARQNLFLGFDHTKVRLELAETAIQSVRPRPESGETHLALAHHLYWAYRDYDQAKAELASQGARCRTNHEFLF
jgi:hypothetical protein